ncbi:ABC transporter substrate-binding protein [Gluconacetobacter sp. 1c LMG 22058]|uniref:ABC transporter substrate-binding protein n=1 Tax=Gluconacetobacter dulcium TaxID=2729096 RepID=A0A7W4JWA4_9PROT|nr:ABC transporter substrate-binding protein [Gluconacetobacter dulcium]MBB2195897.1 ABC transporter substrate-binding protein [Gluconacetobacter dulcium]
MTKGLLNRAAMAATLAAWTLAGAPAVAASAPAADRPVSVRYVFDWPVADFAIVPIAVGQAKGFYRAHGLDVRVILPPDAQTTARMLASGEGDIGFEGATDVVFAANIALPITSIASYSQHNSWCLIGRPGEPINAADLAGRTIGTFTDSWTGAMMRFVLQHAAARAGSVRQIITQVDNIPLLLAGRIDLATNVAAYGVAAALEQTGRMPELACGDAIGVPDIPVWSFTASPAWLARHGDTARAWLAATNEAIGWSVEHPAEAAVIFTRAFPESGSAAFNIAGWRYLSHAMSGTGGYLAQTERQWTILSRALRATGQISTLPPASTYFTNAYIPG